MKRVLFLSLVAVLIAGLVPLSAVAQSATGQAWSTSITYYTPDPVGGTMTIYYYADGSSTPSASVPITLAPHKAGSLFIGNVPGLGASFSGGAVLESDVPVIATAVNIAQTGPDTNYARPLYTGFDAAQASLNFFIPTVLYQKFGYTTHSIGIQNVEGAPVNATLKVFPLGSTTPAFEQTYTIQSQSAKIVTSADMAASLGVGFTGSAVIAATGKVVASVQETADTGRAAKAFEGLAADAGATEIYMASMMCHAYGAQSQTSYYAIQNVGSAQAQVNIGFYDTHGNLLYTATGLTIDVGNKISENPCKYTVSAPALEGAVGSAVITSTNSVPLIAMGKIKGEGSPAMTETAFVGQSAGATKVAAPYIRWKTDPTAGERAYVSVMNVGATDATNIVVNYYDANGNLAATANLATSSNPLPRFIKANTNWGLHGTGGDFGVNPYGGAIEVTSDQPVIVVVRVQKTVGSDVLAEDYNGVGW